MKEVEESPISSAPECFDPPMVPIQRQRRLANRSNIFNIQEMEKTVPEPLQKSDDSVFIRLHTAVMEHELTFKPDELEGISQEIRTDRFSIRKRSIKEHRMDIFSFARRSESRASFSYMPESPHGHNYSLTFGGGSHQIFTSTYGNSQNQTRQDSSDVENPTTPKPSFFILKNRLNSEDYITHEEAEPQMENNQVSSNEDLKPAEEKKNKFKRMSSRYKHIEPVLELSEYRSSEPKTLTHQGSGLMIEEALPPSLSKFRNRYTSLTCKPSYKAGENIFFEIENNVRNTRINQTHKKMKYEVKDQAARKDRFNSMSRKPSHSSHHQYSNNSAPGGSVLGGESPPNNSPNHCTSIQDTSPKESPKEEPETLSKRTENRQEDIRPHSMLKTAQDHRQENRGSLRT